MPRLQIGKCYIGYYGQSSTTSTTIVLELELPFAFTFEPDYYHLEWLSQVWNFSWHKNYDPILEDIPF